MKKRSFYEVAYSLGLPEMPDHYAMSEEMALFHNLYAKQLSPESLEIAQRRIVEEAFLAHTYAISQTLRDVLQDSHEVLYEDGEFVITEKGDEYVHEPSLDIDTKIRATSKVKVRQAFKRHAKVFLDSLSKTAISGEELLANTQSPRVLN